MSSHSYYHSSSVVFFAKLYHCFSFESGLRKIYCRDSFGHLDLKFPAALSVSAFLFPWQPATFWRGGDRFSTNQLPWGVCVSMSAKVSGKITTFWGFLWHGQLDLLKKEKQNDDDKVISAPPEFRVCILFLSPSPSHSALPLWSHQQSRCGDCCLRNLCDHWARERR